MTPRARARELAARGAVVGVHDRRASRSSAAKIAPFSRATSARDPPTPSACATPTLASNADVRLARSRAERRNLAAARSSPSRGRRSAWCAPRRAATAGTPDAVVQVPERRVARRQRAGERRAQLLRRRLPRAPGDRHDAAGSRATPSPAPEVGARDGSPGRRACRPTSTTSTPRVGDGVPFRARRRTSARPRATAVREVRRARRAPRRGARRTPPRAPTARLSVVTPIARPPSRCDAHDVPAGRGRERSTPMSAREFAGDGRRHQVPRGPWTDAPLRRSASARARLLAVVEVALLSPTIW